MDYMFKIPIGDWSDDGHGKCQYFPTKSNKPVEEVREAHFLIDEKVGIVWNSDDAPFSDYGQNTLTDTAVIQAIVDTGYTFESWKWLNSVAEETGQTAVEVALDRGMNYPSSRNLAELWAHLLMYCDPTLKLEVLPEVPMPMLSFYGYDEKGRHISFSGYGLFD